MELSQKSNLLENMPLDVIELIAGYLGVQDLLACCATSRRMRDVFSDDIIWRPRCDKDLCEYLKATPCKVKPHFIIENMKDNSLSPIPKWKEDFMRQNHLWNNWRQGRTVQEVIHSRQSAESGRVDNSICHLFLTSDCVIAVYPEVIELLDVRKYPSDKAAMDIKPPTGKGFGVKAVDDMVIVTYLSYVLVYQIDFSTKKSTMKNVFCFQCNQKLNNFQTNPKEDLKIDYKHCKENHSDPVDGSYYSGIIIAVVGNLLIGLSSSRAVLHIWNVKSGEKLKAQDLPIKGSHVINLKSTETMNLIIYVSNRKSSSRMILAYSLTTFAFLPFRESVEDGCEFFPCQTYVAITRSNLMNVYDYLTSKLLLSNQPIQSQCQTLRNNFVFLQDSILKIFSPTAQVVKPLCLVPGPEIPIVMDQVTWFEILSKKLIQIRRGYFPSQSLCVYEVNDSFQLIQTSLNLEFQSCSFFLNKTSTRYIVRYGCGNIIHFW